MIKEEIDKITAKMFDMVCQLYIKIMERQMARAAKLLKDMEGCDRIVFRRYKPFEVSK